MPSLFTLIRKSGVDVAQCQRYELDTEDFLAFGQTETPHSESVFEVPRPDQSIQSLPPQTTERLPTVLRYFIDGSRRIQKVAEIVVGGRFYPMLAGQIGVAVTERSETDGRIRPVREYCKIQNVISLPDKLGDELAEIEDRINREFPLAFRVVNYDTSKSDRNPNDLAVIRIMTAMLDLEIDRVTAMAASGLLRPDRLLVRDGPLQFMRRLPNPSAYQHAIGISKTFSTNAPIKKGANPLDVGSLVKDLDRYDRTKCYKLEMKDKTIAFWYVRIHPKKMVPNPLDGVIKIEKIAQEQEIEGDGVDRDLVNVISRHVFEERSVTAYGIDRRWANHIYPIYLTERFVKASMDSNVKFSGYFKEMA
jgi:hypothetical protein